jgi:hypothetical protein
MRQTMRREFLSRVTPSALRWAILLGVIGALLTGFMVVNTVTSSSLGNGNVKLANETFSDDSDITVVRKGIKLVQTSTAAAGTSPPGQVEITSGLPAVNNALTENNYAYEFEVKESGVTTLQSGENLKIQVYGDNGTTALLATLYTKQATVADASVEGVTVTVDLGSATTVHDDFDIVVTRQ